ncbi:MAG TPA: hypothetical protein VHF06_24845 [Pseudonocardiaceae bacterium]|nr:hypothetical protein [Pseudonocardiaceae bacterium]
MPRTIYVPVSDRTYETLSARAAAQQLSLSEYVRRDLESLAAFATATDPSLRQLGSTPRGANGGTSTSR